MNNVTSALVVLVLCSSVFAGYSEDFEGKDITALEALGWTFSPWGDPAQFVSIETTITHSGSQALRLPRATRGLFPVDDFGTLDIWVYDAGVVLSGANYYGSNWGLAKDSNWIGGSLQHRSWMDSAVAYGVSFGDDGDVVTSSLYSVSWLDAGLGGVDRSRGVAGWTHWEITFHEPGKIQIDLLEDPNGCTSRRHAGAFTNAPDGIGDANVDGSFNANAVGGATHLYLRGCTTPDVDPASSIFGDLIVDDITWTPKSEVPSLPGDANGDCTVDIQDFVILKQNYGKTGGALWSEGDFNGDGNVDIQDFVILKQNYGSSCPL